VGEYFFWYRLTRLVPNKIQRAVKRFYVCVYRLLLLYPFNGPFSVTTQMIWCQKSKTILVKTILVLLEQETVSGSGVSWAISANLHFAQTYNHASIPPLSFYRPDAVPAAQPTAPKALQTDMCRKQNISCLHLQFV